MESERDLKAHLPSKFPRRLCFCFEKLSARKKVIVIDWFIPRKDFFYHVKSFGSRTMHAKHLTLFAKIMSTGTADFKSNVNWIPVPYSLLGKINFPYPLGQSTRKSDWRCLLKVPFTQNQTLNFLPFPFLSFWTATTPYIKVGGYDFCKSR